MSATSEYRDQLLDLASVEPPLSYQWPGSFPRERRTAPTAAVVAEYLQSQPADYLQELHAWHRINSTGRKGRRVFVFVVCYNELPNLDRIVAQYAGQQGFDLDQLQLTFVVNYMTRSDPRKTAYDADVFRRSVERLLELKRDFDFVHVVAKHFSAATGGLARARKYGLDYSLLSCSLSDPAESLIISNEGDTLELPPDYLRAWTDHFSDRGERFAQGNIAYPAIVERAPLLQLYTHTRESVHLGQGLYDRRYPLYEGIMPTGRNYAVHPRVACLAGGIDPVPLLSAEDDLTFGSDVHNLVGPDAKVFVPGIALTTHPRREIRITLDLLQGRSADAKQIYENFHDITDIYDLEWDRYVEMIETIAQIPDTPANRCIVCNQFYQWVFRTVIKHSFTVDARFRAIFEQGRSHQIGYWERESRLWGHYTEVIETLGSFDRERFLRRLVDETLAWFNELLALPRPFEEASVELQTRLLR